MPVFQIPGWFAVLLFPAGFPATFQAFLRLALAFLILLLSAQLSFAQSPSPIELQVQREQQRQEEQRRSLIPNAPDTPGNPTPVNNAQPIDQEKPCFTFNTFLLQDPAGLPATGYFWALEGTDSFLHRCIGEKSLNALLGKIQNALIGRGLATTRVVAGEQNLKSRIFKMTLVEGRLASVLPGKDTPGNFPWRTALNERSGDLINQRDLEQALEVFKSLPTVDASFQLVPGSKPGESNVVIDWKQQKIWRFSAQADDSGTKETGKLLGTSTLYLENAAGLNELIYASYNHDLDGAAGRHRLQGGSAHMSLPYNYWSLALDAGASNYYQTVMGLYQNYVYSGKTNNFSSTISNIIHRDGTSKTTVSAGLWTKSSSNFIDGTEIDIQRRRTSGFLIEGKHKQYIGPATFELTLTATQAENWFGALPAPEEEFGNGVSRPRLFKAELNSTLPFSFGGFNFTYENTTRGQWTPQPLVLVDQFSIGGRYSVRGFDGELTLAGEKGFVTRNTLSLALGQPEQNFYLGFDHGEVAGHATQSLSGKRLSGAVAGFKGHISMLEYDIFAGIPVAKPVGFNAPDLSLGFMLKATY